MKLPLCAVDGRADGSLTRRPKVFSLSLGQGKLVNEMRLQFQKEILICSSHFKSNQDRCR